MLDLQSQHKVNPEQIKNSIFQTPMQRPLKFSSIGQSLEGSAKRNVQVDQMKGKLILDRLAFKKEINSSNKGSGSMTNNNNKINNSKHISPP